MSLGGMRKALARDWGGLKLAVSTPLAHVEAFVPSNFDVSLNGDPHWDRVMVYLAGDVKLSTMIHEANHASRAIIDSVTASYKGKRRLKPPRGFRPGSDRHRLWREELECYLHTGIVDLLQRWELAGFPEIRSNKDVETAGLPTHALALFDAFRGDYV